MWRRRRHTIDTVNRHGADCGDGNSSARNAMKIRAVDELFRLYRERADLPYDLTDETQLHHALPSAHLPPSTGHGSATAVAALFHALGHRSEEHRVGEEW